MKLVKFVDVPVSENRDILFQGSERIIGISLTNQGTSDIKLAMGGSNAFKKLEAGADVAYGDNNGGSDVFYLTGNLKIVAPGVADGVGWAATFSVVLTIAYDKTDTQADC